MAGQGAVGHARADGWMKQDTHLGGGHGFAMAAFAVSFQVLKTVDLFFWHRRFRRC